MDFAGLSVPYFKSHAIWYVFIACCVQGHAIAPMEYTMMNKRESCPQVALSRVQEIKKL